MTRPRTFEFLYENRTMPVPESGCIIWVGAINNKGYGIYRRGIKTHSAHRAAWVMANGEIKDDLCVLHKCDVRCCVNPDHLYLGTKTDNARDRTSRMRGTIGIRNSHAKLTPELIKLFIIRKQNGETYRELAKEFGMHALSLSRACRGISWKHLAHGENT